MLHSTERRKSAAERRPSTTYTPPVIPHLAGLEKPQAHTLNMDHCDILIMGTGLTESVLAAALSWQGVEVLHIDRNNYYGDLSLTMTIEQLKKWCHEVNQGKIPHFQDAQIYIPGGGSRISSKDYGIDLTPRLMFAQSDLLALLVQLRVYRYLEFQSLSNFHVFENDNFNKNVSNTSKEDIFTDQSLSLKTKRQLMKLLKFILADSQDESKQSVLAENAATPIAEFLEKNFHLETPQINELIYLIGLCPLSQTTAPDALARIRRFLTSFDVYGNFPVMMLKYGGPGEISQGFCRSAAVAGTTYKLNTSLVDYDPSLKVAKFSDGSAIKINEKLVISPSQIPRFLQSGYSEITSKLKLSYVTRMTTIVKRDCKEWMTDNEPAAVVVFPPKSLPTGNNESVQVIIQNGNSGICPDGQSVWYSQTCEQDLRRAKEDLESAYEKMEAALLRETSSNLDEVLDESDFVLSANGTPVVANSFKLGKSLQSFVPKEKLEIICKLGYVQSTFVNLDLSNQMFPTSENNVSLDTLRDAEDIVFTNMPSAEISYDGVVSDCRTLFTRITGSEDDFFDVDFEDEEFDEGPGSTSVSEAVKNGDILMKDHENAIEDSDSDDDRHGPFGTDLMEL